MLRAQKELRINTKLALSVSVLWPIYQDTVPRLLWNAGMLVLTKYQVHMKARYPKMLLFNVSILI